MITPFFTITQNDEFLFIDVKISHIRFNAKTIEMVVDNDVFIFSLPPYYLRLRFPHKCVEDERSQAEFDSVSGFVKIKIPKEIKGQEFPDLDLTAKLLARTNEIGQEDTKNKKPMIEEMDVDNKQVVANLEDEGEEFNWEMPQEAPEAVNLSPSNKYGFNNEYSEIVGVSVSNGNDINELGDPENTPEINRVVERLIKENIKFDPEYYAADYIMEKYPSADNDKDFATLLAWKAPYVQKFLKWYKQQQLVDDQQRQQIMDVDFTTSEQEIMQTLPKKTYLLDNEHKQELLVLIISLLYSYYFDMRETEGDHNVESAWTVGKLTPQIACLDTKLSVKSEYNEDNMLKAAIIAGIRRSLSYPLHRSYDISMKVWDDVYYTLRGGKRLILKCLFDVKELFRYHDIYYVYDKIWLQDLCSWLINEDVSEMTIRKLGHDLKRELEKVTREEVVFEKADIEGGGGADEDEAKDSDDESDDESNERNNESNEKDNETQNDEMITLSLREIEIMAENQLQLS